jgi:ATP-dependent Clp protease ATP-binding subunit ClpA
LPKIRLDLCRGLKPLALPPLFLLQFGARPLNRLIQSKVLNHIATLMLSNTLTSGDSIHIDIKKGELVFETKKKRGRISPVKISETGKVK